MEEKSGMEILEEILKRLDIIEKKINILDFNIKNIINSTKTPDSVANKIHDSQSEIKKELNDTKKEQIAGFKNFKFEASDVSKIKHSAIKAPGPKNIMVRGRMVANIDGKQTPLPNILVKIYDNKDFLIKETRTNRAGYWLSQLLPGKYVALFDGELNGKKLVPQNRNFIVPENLPEGQSDIEVV